VRGHGVTTSRLVAIGAAVVAFAFFGESWGFDEYGFSRSAGDLVAGLSFAIAGLVAWGRRPENRTGPVMVALGAAWFAPNFRFADSSDLVHTFGLISWGPASVLAGYLLLAFPEGRLRGERAERAALAFLVLVSIPVYFTRLLFYDSRNHHGCDDCSDATNLLGHPTSTGAERLADGIYQTGLALALLAVVGVLIVRIVRASRPARRTYGPALAGALVFGVVTAFAQAFGETQEQEYTVFADIVFGLFLASSTLIPTGMLVGVLRTRAGRTRLSDMLVRLQEVRTGGALRDLLAESLGDPHLHIALWAPSIEHHVDEAGVPVELPGPDDPQVATHVRGVDGPLAVLLHDPALLEDRRMLDAVVAGARFALENERLQAEVRAQLAEVRASRARIVETADEERRRIERDLHDGAQQRLVSLALGLQMMRDQVGADADPALAELLDAVTDEAKGAVTELRELARGIHPAILTDEGLGAALKSLAERSPVPVRLDCRLDGQRPPAPVEAAGYFACAESLTNAVKHAGATEVEVRAVLQDGTLRIAVSDDGAGGASLASGTGLRGIRDRVTALGGDVEVRSPRGEGTVIDISIPIEDQG
jgi:signal transduction histidine kinase